MLAAQQKTLGPQFSSIPVPPYHQTSHLEIKEDKAGRASDRNAALRKSQPRATTVCQGSPVLSRNLAPVSLLGAVIGQGQPGKWGLVRVLQPWVTKAQQLEAVSKLHSSQRVLSWREIWATHSHGCLPLLGAFFWESSFPPSYLWVLSNRGK